MNSINSSDYLRLKKFEVEIRAPRFVFIIAKKCELKHMFPILLLIYDIVLVLSCLIDLVMLVSFNEAQTTPLASLFHSLREGNLVCYSNKDVSVN